MPSIEVSSLKLGELQVSSKGTKQVPITQNGEVLKWTPGPLQVLFHPKAYNNPNASRVSVCFKSTPEVETYVRELEAWVLKQVSSSPQLYLGPHLGNCTPQQVHQMFTSALKTSEKGWSHLRTKMNLAGKSQVRCWDESRKPRPAPEDWTLCEVQPCLHIKGLWIMNKEFGLLIELADALVSESSQLCPF